MSYFLGIDGGGSKTTCVVGDDSILLATATAGPSNVVRVGEARTRESLHLAVRQACAAAGITPAQVAHTCIGAAGATRPEIAGIVRRALAEILSPPIEVVGDMHIALESALEGSPGVVVIAGTGSIAYGRDEQGNIARVGGWGFAVFDEGSAHWIGRNGIAAALRAADEQATGQAASGTSSQLAGALMKVWQVDSLDDLAAAANATPPPDFAALFPAVLSAADAGDEVAKNILTQAGRELARLACLVIRQLFPQLPTSSDRPRVTADACVPVAMAGSVFRYASLVRDVFYNEMRTAEPRAKLNLQVVDPVLGALRLARKAPPRSVGAP